MVSIYNDSYVNIIAAEYNNIAWLWIKKLHSNLQVTLIEHHYCFVPSMQAFSLLSTIFWLSYTLLILWFKSTWDKIKMWKWTTWDRDRTRDLQIHCPLPYPLRHEADDGITKKKIWKSIISVYLLLVDKKAHGRVVTLFLRSCRIGLKIWIFYFHNNLIYV